MKFLCVPCDSPMKLQTVDPPERGSLSIVYSCPECGYEIAMLTNAYETQVVQSLGVQIGPEVSRAASDRAHRRQMSVLGDDSGQTKAPRPLSWRTDSRPVDCRRGSAAREIPEFVRPMARTGIERFARERGAWKWTRRSSTRPREFFGM